MSNEREIRTAQRRMLFQILVGMNFKAAAESFVNQLITEMDAEDVSHAKQMAEIEIAKWEKLMKQ
jgi:hypothetical protein